MRKVGFFKFLIIFLISVPCWGQKVKYKDIYGLLRAKQYDEAEPVLKQFLSTNDDTPSAYLYMGLILEEKSGRIDILKQTSQAVSTIDSAIFYLSKAYTSITDKEVKKHDEYYEIYNRRDLRTGEFGVKLSDIKFDLEKKRDALDKSLAAAREQLAATAKEREQLKVGLKEKEEIADSARAQLALMNKQMAALRQQLDALNAALDAAEPSGRHGRR